MKRAELEQRVLHLWVSSQVPLTAVHLHLYLGQKDSKLSREKLLRMLDELVRDEILELDSDEAGEMVWTVPGATRAPDGLRRIEEIQRLESLRAEVDKPARAARPAPRAPAPIAARSDGKKSLIASGALSFFLGPLGWLYAAPLGEAVPALLLYLFAALIVPGIVLKPLLGVFAPLSAIAGALYAWAHNARGERTSLLDAGRAIRGHRLLGPRRDE